MAKLLAILLLSWALIEELAAPSEPPLLIDATVAPGGATQSADAELDASQSR